MTHKLSVGVTTDQQILTLLKDDKEAGFQVLFDRYYRPMCILGVKYIQSLDVVEDLVQDILLKIWNQNSLQNISNLRAYLFTAVKNKCYTFLKSKKQVSLEEINLDWEKDLYIQEDDEEYIKEKLELLQKAIDALPPGCREVFDRVVLAGHTYKEVASDLNISVNTVKSQMKRAYRSLDNDLHLLLLLLLIR